MTHETDYIEVTLKGKEAYLDILPSLLLRLDFSAFQNADDALLAYCPESQFSEEALISLLKTYEFDRDIKYKIEKYPGKNWNASWEASFSPVFVSDRVVVRAPFHPTYSNYPYRITISPKMAFGTGHHATTCLMIRRMIPLNLKGKKVLDYGCGTGVLAIFAHVKGASPVIAIDNNPFAFQNSRENFGLNDIQSVELYQQDIAERPDDEKFDIILANITRNVILHSLENIASRLNAGGSVITSGYFADELPKVRSAAEQYNMSLGETLEDEEWVCAEFRLNN